MTKEEAIIGMYGALESAKEWGDTDGIAMFEMAIKALKADVTPIVRCKDCKHRGTDKCPSRLDDADFFCCQGEMQ